MMFLSTLVLAVALGGGDDDAPAANADGTPATVFMQTGKSQEVDVHDPAVRIDTGYGVQIIPLADVSLVRFATGTPLPEDLSPEDIQLSIEELADPDPVVRGEAEVRLADAGAAAAPALREAAQSEDLEVVEVAQSLLDALPQSQVDPDVNLDTVITRTMVLRGRVLNESWKLGSETFGHFTVASEKVLRISFVPRSMASLMLPASLGRADDVGNWRIAKEAPGSWTSLSFDDSQWAAPQNFQYGYALSSKKRAEPGTYYLRRTFALDDVPEEGLLTVKNAEAYQVYVNSQALETTKNNKYDLRDVLRPGPNVLAVRFQGKGRARVLVEFK